MSVSSRSVLDHVIIPESPFYKGRFGRMFRSLPAWTPPAGDNPANEAAVIEALKKFADNQMSEKNGDEKLDNDNLPAGYTYFGQFIDHDITFDPTSSVDKLNDPNKLTNFRSPRLDLDCLYGEGPDDEPFMYDNKRKGMFLIGRVKCKLDGTKVKNSKEPDLPRNTQGRALIGDMRNDENVIVSQIQLSMLRLHNRVLASLMFDTADMAEVPKEFNFDKHKFSEAQRIVRWFYQYVVWNDYIKRLIMDDFWGSFLSRQEGAYVLNTRFYKWKNTPFMPVEFSVAAYRYGHSLVRPGYQVNLNDDVGLGFRQERPIFDPKNGGAPDLKGFRFFPHRHTVQWDWFLQYSSSQGGFPQPSRLIDPQLASAIFKVPDEMGGANHLAFLNLRRSWRMGLPSGSCVARSMGFQPHKIKDRHEDILWYYILKESRAMPGSNSGRMLGKVGGTIIGEVFAGLLHGDAHSFIRIDAQWKPQQEPALKRIFDAEIAHSGLSKMPEIGNDWQLADLLRAAGAPISGEDVKNTIATGSNQVPVTV